MLTNQDFTQERRHYLGGSDIGALLGLSSYKTPLDLWLEKTGKANTHADSLPLRFGSFAEEFVASEYASQTGSQLHSHPQPITHPQYPYFAAHIDRFVLGPTVEKSCHKTSDIPSQPLFDEHGKCLALHLLECKTTSSFLSRQWGDKGSDQIPLPYLCQCAWYLAITQMERIDLAVLLGNSDFRIYTIRRDLELENLLIKKAADFWVKYVQADCPPPLANENDCQKLFPQSLPLKKRIADPYTLQSLLQLHEVNQQMKTLESKTSDLKMNLMKLMGDAEILCYEDNVLLSWKSTKGGTRCDLKRLEAEHPELVTQYQIPISPTRRFILKDWPFSQGALSSNAQNSLAME